jgi:hypothetical protein
LRQTYADLLSRLGRSALGLRVSILSVGILSGPDAGSTAAAAVEPDTMFPPLEACMEAAVQKQKAS